VVIGNTLSDQKITVSQDADCLAGDDVNGPFAANCQAMVINKHTMGITGGQTYSELAKDDPNRATAMDSAFLQASLFTSVVAFGVALMAFVVGVVLTLIGLAIRAPHRCLASRWQPPDPAGGRAGSHCHAMAHVRMLDLRPAAVPPRREGPDGPYVSPESGIRVSNSLNIHKT
jgi:hypothetical protein